MGDKLKAKDASLIGQIVAALYIAGWNSAKFLQTGLTNVSSTDILIAGVSIAACFMPVYISILVAKYTGTEIPAKTEEAK